MEPGVVMVLITEVATLDARVTLVHRIVDHATNGNNAISGDINIYIDRAASVTEPAERSTCFDSCLGLHAATPSSAALTVAAS